MYEKPPAMKIGFIGTPSLSGQLFHPVNGKYEVSGIFSGTAAAEKGLKMYSSAEALIGGSDVLFISRNAPEAFEAGKMAVKEARHLFIESAFSMEPDQLEELYGLSEESRSMVYLGQPLPYHPLYVHLRKSLYPGLILIRIDSAAQYRSKEAMQQLWFDVASLVYDAVPYGVRRTGVHIVHNPQDARVPAACQVRIDFSNGAQTMVLVNHFTGQEGFMAEFYQEEGRYQLDLYSGKALHYQVSSGETAEVKKAAPGWDTLMAESFNSWVEAVLSGRIPLTLNEQGQAVYQLTRELLAQIDYRKQLFA